MRSSASKVSKLLTLSLFALFAILFAQRTYALHSCQSQWKELIPRGDHRYAFKKESYAAYSKRVNRENCQKDWTVLIYMAADNDLAPYGLWDLYEMESGYSRLDLAASTPKLDVLVQWERGSSNTTKRLHLFQSDTKFEVKNLGDFEGPRAYQVKSPVVEELPSPRSGQEESRFREFLKWGAHRYPSKNLMVIVWGHGQGWTALAPKVKKESRYLTETDAPISLPRPTLTEAAPSSRRGRWGGLAFSDSSGGFLSIPALKRSLTSLSQLIKKPVDLYVSDACLMQMAEVATEISQPTRFVAGSTQVQSFLGLPYRRIFYEINTGRFAGLRKVGGAGAEDQPWLVAKMIPELMRASLDPTRGNQGKVDPTSGAHLLMSSISSSELRSRLVPSLNALGHALSTYLREDPLRQVDLQFVLSQVPAFEGNAQDLRIFTVLLQQLLHQESQGARASLTPAALRLKHSAQNVRDALGYTVMGFAMGRSYTIDPLTERMGYLPMALSVYLPPSSEDWKNRRSDFRKSELYRLAPAWAAWPDLLYP